MAPPIIDLPPMNTGGERSMARQVFAALNRAQDYQNEGIPIC
jgi:hypothetical protein